MARLAISVGAFCLTALLLAGCGKGDSAKHVKVSGKVHDAGKPLKVGNPMTGGIEVVFFEVKDGAVVTDYPVTVNPSDGTYVAGVEGKGGIPPGKYKIVVRHYDPRPDDKLKDKFSDKNSRIIREVKEGQDTVIDIDVSKAEG